MKSAFYLTLFVIAFTACRQQNDSTHDHETSAPKVEQDTVKKSIPKEVHAKAGDAHVMIKYHAPAVRGRTIWGGLVPYGDVWVTGAHSATTLEIDKGIILGGKEIPAGKYALFTIPDKDKWTVIINKNWEQHLADEYDAKEDVVRVDVAPEKREALQERLRYSVENLEKKQASIGIVWEHLVVTVPFQVQ
jgi:hypothetical protein